MVHHKKARSAIQKLMNQPEPDTETLKNIVQQNDLEKPKELLYRSLIRMPQGERKPTLEAINALSEADDGPEKLRRRVYATSKKSGVKWHLGFFFLAALTVKQLRQVGRVVRGEVPKPIRNSEKIDLLFWIVNGLSSEAEKDAVPQKLSKPYANALNVSRWHGRTDEAAIERQKGHEVTQEKREKRNQTRKPKASQPAESPETENSETAKPEPETPTEKSDLHQALNTLRGYIEDGASEGGMNEDDVREIAEQTARETAQDYLGSEKGRDQVREVVDRRIESKMDDVSLDLSFA
jgi:hypothetical protein